MKPKAPFLEVVSEFAGADPALDGVLAAARSVAEPALENRDRVAVRLRLALDPSFASSIIERESHESAAPGSGAHPSAAASEHVRASSPDRRARPNRFAGCGCCAGRTRRGCPSRARRRVARGRPLLARGRDRARSDRGIALGRALPALFAAWFPGAEKTVAPNQSAEFSLVVAGARVCYALDHGLVDTALCAGFEAGQISARGAGLLEARQARDLWLAPDIGLALRAEPWSSFALGAHAEAIAPLLRQGYGIDQTESIYHVRSLGVRAGFGFLVGF
jgi:hypothetical protein